MIKKLKIKFIVLGTSVLFALLAAIVFAMNLVNYRSMINEADGIISLISENNGAFPVNFQPSNTVSIRISTETAYESRFFSIAFDKNGNITDVNTNQIMSVDSGTAVKYGYKIYESGSKNGFLGIYRYVVTQDHDNTIVTFLDCDRRLSYYNNFLSTSLIMAAIGLGAGFLIIFIFSGRIVRPVAESYKKQKQFITDAGHEIKTPLAIINANVDLLEMESDEENESLVDIRNQVERLRILTDDLIMLSKIEEGGQIMNMANFSLSDTVNESADSFYALAESQNKNIVCNIAPDICICGDKKYILQLNNILIENAIKYSSPSTDITVSLTKNGKYAELSIHNFTETEVDGSKLNSVFDRFYRTDSSRNSETGGYGIGLSVAKGIVSSHGGKISAATSDGHDFKITAVFPVPVSNKSNGEMVKM